MSARWFIRGARSNGALLRRLNPMSCEKAAKSSNKQNGLAGSLDATPNGYAFSAPN